MPNIAAVLKDEIARIAKKEAKRICSPLAKTVATLKKTIASQRKQIAELQATLAKQQKSHESDETFVKEKAEEFGKSRLGAKNIAKLRKKLDLSRAEMAKLIGASANSIFFWESGNVTPRASAKAKILALRKLGKREISKRLATLAEK